MHGISWLTAQKYWAKGQLLKSVMKLVRYREESRTCLAEADCPSNDAQWPKRRRLQWHWFAKSSVGRHVRGAAPPGFTQATARPLTCLQHSLNVFLSPKTIPFVEQNTQSQISESCTCEATIAGLFWKCYVFLVGYFKAMSLYPSLCSIEWYAEF
jgi:hypothetical protein